MCDAATNPAACFPTLGKSGAGVSHTSETPARPQGGTRLRGQIKAAHLGRPLITVITVVKNGAASLERTLRSVLDQTYTPLEYIVRDGGSSDGTLDLLRRYDDRLDFWYSAPDAGIYDAMNQAVAEAHGAWLLFLGADDVLQPGFAAVAAQCCNHQTIYYGDVLMAQTGRRYDGPFGPAKLARQNICQQAILYPRTVFAKYSFDVRYRIQADWEFNMRCFGDPQFRFQYIRTTVCAYNDISGSSSIRRDLVLEQDYPRLLWRHFPAWIAAWYSALTVGGRMLRYFKEIK
jgi:glycosyltransferase involved in cell wall biosynthesis